MQILVDVTQDPFKRALALLGRMSSGNAGDAKIVNRAQSLENYLISFLPCNMHFNHFYFFQVILLSVVVINFSLELLTVHGNWRQVDNLIVMQARVLWYSYLQTFSLY